MSANRLIHETSPYLLQHAHNPVDWWPWGEEAFAKAQAEDKPVLLSIGYSACHWCHVMAHESFEDATVAEVMNRLFVSVKVDREERPDLDRVYQHAHQLLNGRGGGWPLTVVLTPDDRVPFFSGTYFPKEPRFGLPGIAEILERVAAVYRERGDEVRAQNVQLATALRADIPRHGASGYGVNPAPLGAVVDALLADFDREHGGFGGAPKFPQTGALSGLLRHAHAARVAGKPDAATEHALHFTLLKMADGGLFDALGGGFFRYAVDARWEIPHFEKMLYDNGPLLALYAEAYRYFGDARLREVAEATADWVLREMRAPGGAFYATLDADSEGEEGRFYTWTPDEARAVLDPDEYAIAAACLGLDAAPNFEGRWHLRRQCSPADAAARLGLAEDAAAARFAAAHAKLLAARDARPRPHRDEKILTAWNALMIRALALAGRLLARPDWLAAAEAALGAIRRTLWRDGRLYASLKDARPGAPGFLDDHACLLEALLELLQSRWRGEDFAWARALADTLLARFEDPRRGGFHFNATDAEALIQRPKPLFDEALPSGNGVAARALSALGHLLGHLPYLVAAERTLKWAWPVLERQPTATAALLDALEEHFFPGQRVLLRADEAATLERWCARAAGRFAPRRFTLALPPDAAGFPNPPPAPAQGVAAFVCRGAQCAPPLERFEDFDAALAADEASAA